MPGTERVLTRFNLVGRIKASLEIIIITRIIQYTVLNTNPHKTHSFYEFTSREGVQFQFPEC